MSRKVQERRLSDRRSFLEGSMLAAGVAALGTLPGNRAAAAEPPRPAAPAPGAAPQGRQQPKLTTFTGKTIYITGGNTGIGLGIARAAANAGMNVVMGYIQEDQVEPALSLFKADQKPRVIAIRHDVTDREGWTKTLAEINAKFGNLHLLVNNAGIKTLTQASRADARGWDSAVAVNFTGIYNGCAAVVPHMLQHGEGSHIVTTASMGGLLPGASAGVYTATKFAAVGMMEALRVELAGTNIGTSVYAPGGVSTDNMHATEGSAVAMMDPLEAGERVLNGVKYNDLFILTHPEFKAGMQQRFDAIIASVPDEPAPEARVRASARVLTSPAYAPEIEHRRQKRSTYRG